jgi:hypothetical protein
MPREQPTTETVIVKNNMVTTPDSVRAAGLFARILRAVREQTAEDEQRGKSGHESAA